MRHCPTAHYRRYGFSSDRQNQGREQPVTRERNGIRLTPEDALMLQFESRGVSFHTLKIAILDSSRRGRPVSLDELATWVPVYLGVTPRLTQRVERRSYWHWEWVDDTGFDIRHHLAEVTVDGMLGLDELCGELAGGHLDQSRPLWKVTLVHGLPDGRQAVVAQIHHSIMDGSAAMNTFTAVTSEDPDVAPPVPVRVPPAALDRPAFPARFGAFLAAGVRSRKRTKEFAPDHTLPREMLRKTRFNPKAGPDLVCGSRQLPMTEVRELARLLDTGVNGVVHAVLALAIREYMIEAGDEPTHSIVMTYGVVADPSSKRTDGNKLATARLWMHIDDPDPLSLARRTAYSARRSVDLRRHRGFAFQQHANDYAWLIPPVVATLFDFLPFTPVHMQSAYVSGSKTARWFGDVQAVGFLSHAVSVAPANTTITAYQYAGNLWIGVQSCPEAIPDVQQFMGHVVRAQSTLLDQARLAQARTSAQESP